MYGVRPEFRRPCGRRIHRSPTENYSARFGGLGLELVGVGLVTG